MRRPTSQMRNGRFGDELSLALETTRRHLGRYPTRPRRCDACGTSVPPRCLCREVATSVLSRDELTAFQAGDEAVVNELVRRHSLQLRSEVRRYVREPDDTADILQECWIRAYSARSTLRDRRSFTGWLARIAHNVAMSYLRKQAREREVIDRQLSPEHNDVSIEPDAWSSG